MSSRDSCTCQQCAKGFTSSLLPTDAQIASIHELTRSGALPPNPSIFHASIFETTAEVLRYNAEIAKVEEEMDRLYAERRALQSYVNGCRSVLSAFHRLPNELLSSIFELCSPTENYRAGQDLTEDEEVEHVSQDHLLQLAQVSSRWYHIVMETPRLWSNIALDTAVWDDCDIPETTLLSLLETSLERGQGHPLNLQLGIFCEYGHGESVLELVSRHAHRWKNVRVVTYDFPSQQTSNRCAQFLGRLDKLETLDLEVGWQLIQSLDAPHLSQFAFSGKFCHLPKVPWAQLRRVRYHSMHEQDSPFSILSILPHAHDSAKFSLRLDLRNCPTVAPSNLSVSSDIQHLAFALHTNLKDPAPVGMLFDCMTLPSLRSLICEPPADYCTLAWPCDRFLALAHRSQFSTHLISFSIDADVTAEDLLRCLEALPQLEKLAVKEFPCYGRLHTTVTNVLFEGLSYVSNVAPVIPNLQILTLQSALEFADSEYVDFVASRVKKAHIDGKGPFRANLFWQPESRDLLPETVEKLSELVFGGGLVFESGQINGYGSWLGDD
ncbi:hypothetical protein R3P38DRAFT_2838302 [Favolaschia claudopus]|uniref:F-box domain-containing protein n=1 Tax=Favolaschia claudopus TaxID=2862362 RepID=A0AAW0E3P7_9AGAR